MNIQCRRGETRESIKALLRSVPVQRLLLLCLLFLLASPFYGTDVDASLSLHPYPVFLPRIREQGEQLHVVVDDDVDVDVVDVVVVTRMIVLAQPGS